MKLAFEVFGISCLIVSCAFAAGPKPQTELEHILYDMGVIGYCSLGSTAVQQGFNRQLNQVIVRDGIDQSELNDARNRAMTMVEWEWDNRGLGGFRGWCKTEGQAAVNRFESVTGEP